MTAGAVRGGASDARARGIALAVLLQGGLPAWLAAVEPVLSIVPSIVPSIVLSMRPVGTVGTVRPAMERPTSEETRPARTVAPDVLPPAQQGEVTRLLAALVLSTARTARHDPSPARAREGAIR